MIRQRSVFALALWNGEDPILKERMFGLTNSEGNHGEDVKEYYFYLDNTPTHSYMKYLYKYPQAAFPYNALIQTNRQRSRYEFEYELLDTGIFDDNRYFDVFVEYAKQTPEDLLVQIRCITAGRTKRCSHLLPTLWFRNTWWQSDRCSPPGTEGDPCQKEFDVQSPSATPIWESIPCMRRVQSRSCLPKMRPTSSVFLGSRTPPAMSRMGSTTLSSMAMKGRSIQPIPERKPPLCMCWRSVRERSRSSGCA